MTRLIDADALKTIKSIQSADFNSIETIRQWIDSAPTIDIVRCKDCKWYENACTFFAADPFEQAPMEKNDFCSFGIRREE